MAYRFDDEGRIIDAINGEVIGICTQKKKEILADYDTLAQENRELKTRIEETDNLLEKYKDTLPGELRKLVEKPPTVESLQNQIVDLRAMVATLVEVLKGDAENVNDTRAVPETGTKSRDTKSGGRKTAVDGN